MSRQKVRRIQKPYFGKMIAKIAKLIDWCAFQGSGVIYVSIRVHF